MSNSANKVLIVDDDFISLEVLKAMVGQYPVQVLTAQSGQEAIDTTLSEKPQLILLDHELPDFDGIEVYCRLAQQLGDDMPMAAMVTGHQDDNFAERCHAAGINKRLHKPVQPRELADLLRIASGIE